MPRETRHVVRHPEGGWVVKKGGSSHIAKIYKTQKEAITRGKEISRRNGAELYIHRRDGLIREKNSYGSDPYPPRG